MKNPAPLLGAAIDAEGWKYVRTDEEQSLFHLPTDPYEATPIEDEERVAVLRAELRRYILIAQDLEAGKSDER
jgi:hypothetical protein